ncbi:MAG TPA: mechanosensitive ion channel domain-containing protein [Kofleriaceae bacterium]
MLDAILKYLRTPLVVLSGTPVTALTIVTAIAIMVFARVAAAIITRSMERVLATRGLDRGMRFAAQKITRYIIMLIALFVALGTIGVNMSAVMGAGAVLLVGIGFGLQKLAENFISGLLLLLERPVQKGDFIDVGGLLGTVDDIGLRATRVISRDGVTMIVPNANLVTQMVVNHTVPTESRRIKIEVGVAYGTDLDRVCKVLNDLTTSITGVLREPATEVRHLGFGDSAINLALLCWIEHARDELSIASALRFAIDRAFRLEQIEIPFPQRTLHMLPPAA